MPTKTYRESSETCRANSIAKVGSPFLCIYIFYGGQSIARVFQKKFKIESVLRIFLGNFFCSRVEKRKNRIQNKIKSVFRKKSVKKYFPELKSEIFLFKIKSETFNFKHKVIFSCCQQFSTILHHCYYLHIPSNSVSPVCGIL